MHSFAPPQPRTHVLSTRLSWCRHTHLSHHPIPSRLQAGNFNFQEPPPDDSDNDQSGNPKVQNALDNMLKFEIEKKNVEKYVEESAENLKKAAEEAKEEMDKLLELSKMRGDVAFDSAMADINKEVDEFEAKLRASRQEQAAQDAAFGDWEEDLAASRSEGQFFKSLYQTDKKKPVGDSAAKMQRQQAERVKVPAQQEIGSPLRFYLFLALAFMLIADVGADVAREGGASVGPDVLYTGLAALAVWLAVNEKRIVGK